MFAARRQQNFNSYVRRVDGQSAAERMQFIPRLSARLFKANGRVVSQATEKRRWFGIIFSAHRSERARAHHLQRGWFVGLPQLNYFFTAMLENMGSFYWFLSICCFLIGCLSCRLRNVRKQYVFAFRAFYATLATPSIVTSTAYAIAFLLLLVVIFRDPRSAASRRGRCRREFFFWCSFCALPGENRKESNTNTEEISLAHLARDSR